MINMPHSFFKVTDIVTIVVDIIVIVFGGIELFLAKRKHGKSMLKSVGYLLGYVVTVIIVLIILIFIIKKI